MKTRRPLVILTLGLAMFLACARLLGGAPLPAARAADITTINSTADDLTDNGNCTLREAIQAANTDAAVDVCAAGSGADAIVLPAGTYTLTLAGASGEDNNATGDLDVTAALTITGAGPAQTVIDANGIDRIFDVRPGAGTVVISGVTVINGDVTGSGGGIRSENADLTLINTVVASNNAVEGGGVHVESGSATLSGGRIDGNSADRGGGVSVNYGNVTSSEGHIISNSASWGGGIYAGFGSVALSGGLISGNSAQRGGGVFLLTSYASAMLSGTEVLDNSASEDGGGVYVNSGGTTLSGGLISGNSAQYDGGGVFAFNGDATFTQTEGTIAYNSAQDGGGVYAYWGRATLSGGQIISNSASDSGGGVFVFLDSGIFVQTGGQVIGNVARYGGGVYVCFGSTILNGGQIISNSASYDGGGAYVYMDNAVLSMSEGQIANNTANLGGGVYVYGMTNATLSMSGGRIISNTANHGGGVYVHAIGAVFTQTGVSTVAHNSASYGGGVYVDSGYATLNGGYIAGNTAAKGGGIFNGDGAVTLTHTTVSQNVGSGLAGRGGATTVLSSTIEANDVGLALGGAASTGSLVAHNTFISGNLTAGLVYTGGNTFTVTLGGAPGRANSFRNNGPEGGLNVNVAASASHRPINAFWNDWGFDDVQDVEARLYHQFDDVSLARVDYYTLTLAAAPAQQPADGVSGVALTATLDGLLPPVVGEVIFTSSLGALSVPTDTASASHQANVTLTSNVAGTALVTATTNADPSRVRARSATVDFLSDLRIEKAVGPGETISGTLAIPWIVAVPGQTITYALTFSNAGPGIVTGIVITDRIPPSVTVLSVRHSAVGITATEGISCVWQVQDLMPGEWGTITVTGALSRPLAMGTFVNTAVIAGALVDSVPGNNSSSVGVIVPDVAPVAMDDGYTTDENTPLRISAPGVLGNDGDGNGDPLTAVMDSPLAGGTLIHGPSISGTLLFNADGSFVYTPTLGFSGVVSFTYHAHDNRTDSNVATVEIAVNETLAHAVFLPVVMKSDL
jgi:CSLREA domain-containing protein/uncharacterized repeat protein (TIGR01451 family)